MCHTTCSSAYCADCFSTELVMFVCLWCKKGKINQLSCFLKETGVQVLNILFFLVSLK